MPDVTMSTVEVRAETLNEFTYTNNVGGEVGSDLPETVFSDVLPKVDHTVMTQLALQCGLRKFGHCGKEDVSSELMQIYMQETYVPTYSCDVTREERRQAVEMCFGRK